MSETPTIHANCVVVGEAGVLIRGRSGAGKSSFSESLIERAREAGLFARLVADDRTRLSARHGRLIASVPERLAGLIERRGIGIVETPFLAAAVVRLVVDLEDAPERMPERSALWVVMDGITLPRVVVARNDRDASALVVRVLAAGFVDGGCDPFALAQRTRTGGRKHPARDAPKIRTSTRKGDARRPTPEHDEVSAETA